jgi:hypothetical protein
MSAVGDCQAALARIDRPALPPLRSGHGCCHGMTMVPGLKVRALRPTGWMITGSVRG